MDYTKQSVSALIRGPLISTPQGWVVLGSVGIYPILAIAFGEFGVVPPLGMPVGRR